MGIYGSVRNVNFILFFFKNFYFYWYMIIVLNDYIPCGCWYMNIAHLNSFSIPFFSSLLPSSSISTCLSYFLSLLAHVGRALCLQSLCGVGPCTNSFLPSLSLSSLLFPSISYSSRPQATVIFPGVGLMLCSMSGNWLQPSRLLD